MLKTLYAHHQKPDHDLSFQDVLLKVRDILAESKYTQIPQLTSSRPLDVTSPFEIVPDGNSGTKRAVIIGINYVGQQGELSGCQNDAKNMAEYIKDVWGFEESNITFLMDDGENPDPTMEILSTPLKNSSAIPRKVMWPLFTTRVTEERSATIMVMRRTATTRLSYLSITSRLVKSETTTSSLPWLEPCLAVRI
jgi:hypothetical protein